MDNIEKIKSKLDIVELIQGYLKVQKAGANFKARCPFHNEKTPSFMISPERQIWHCFGCGKGGDHFGFIKEMEGVEFSEALRMLASRAGIELERFEKGNSDKKTRLFEICDWTNKFFKKQLFESTAGKRALKYLLSRGLKEETIKEWDLGYAPEKANSLTKFLEGNGYVGREIVDAGLSVSTYRGVVDRFQSRIIFPIRDINKRAVGFTGRIFPESSNKKIAKYINTPQTLIYDKGRILYGLDKAKTDVRRENSCIVVEGNTDVIMSHQAEVRNCVASSGTALTADHLKIIKRYTDNLTLSFDSDEAGLTAASRGIDLSLQMGFNIKLLDLGGDKLKDPADLIKANPAKWRSKITESKSIIQFNLDNAFRKFSIKTAEGKKHIASNLLPLIKNIANKVEQAYWISDLSARLKVGENILWRQLDITKADSGYGNVLKPEYSEEKLSDTHEIKLEEALLSLLIKKPSFLKKFNVESKGLSSFAVQVINKLKKAESDDFDSVAKMFSPEFEMRLNVIYLQSQELWGDSSENELFREYKKLATKIKEKYLKAKLQSLELDIKEAENKKDRKKCEALLVEFNTLSKNLINLNK